MEAVGQENVRPSVAIVVDPGGGGEVIVGLLWQQVAVIAEAVAEVGEQFRPGGRGQEQVRFAVAVVVGPDGSATAADRTGKADFAQGFATVLQETDLAASDQAQVRLTVAVEIDASDGLGLRIDPTEG